ncbi:aspartate/glutamate racemase family protein [Hoeflea sp. TYP-13]|uniref:aspartate/glutamate racemase family protein n=1 Tax=Hoeflea sp. TYP-13 TaxID=3230023 RepID=UPI0034C61C1A
MIVGGGKSVYGASIGILMLEAQFPRIPGDMGNAATWPFPVHYKVVRGASPERVVLHNAEGLLDPFIDAAEELVSDGCDGLTTNCGFLSLFQDELTEAVGVPVAASSLMQAPMIEAMLPPDRRVGIVTISASSLSDAHLQAAGVDLDTPIVGTDAGEEFTRVILGNEPELDVDAARRDLVNASSELISSHEDVGAILLECTNMMPYAADIARATVRPVFTMESFVTWFQGALVPRRYRLD